MDDEVFNSFFKPYADNVDSVENSSTFWKLSDALILELLNRHILSKADSSSTILDAGGGTGRWVAKMAKHTSAKFIIYDRSEDMLAKARINIVNAELEDRVDIIQGDLLDMRDIEDNTVDHIVSIYSPISFIYKPDVMIKELYRVLKPGGFVMIMSHGYYNALASKINNYDVSAEELLNLYKNKIVKWAAHVPELVTHSKEGMESLLTNAGFSISTTFGVPALVQPGPEDFSPTNDGESEVSKLLRDPDIFKVVFDIEMDISGLSTVANRGVNIFTLVSKP